MHGERHLRVGSVHRAGTGVHEMGDLAVATLFEHLEEAEDVGRDVGVRPLQGVAHAGLGSEVNDALKVASVEQLIHRFRVCQGGAHQLEVALLLQYCEARLLESDVIVVVHGVETDHLVPVCEEPVCDMETDESCRTCHEYSHRLFSVWVSPGATEPFAARPMGSRGGPVQCEGHNSRTGQPCKPDWPLAPR